MANPFVHVELNTPDPVKAKCFYAELFDWQLEDVPNPAVPTGTYTMIKVGEGTGGGIMKKIPDGPPGWLAYVEVADIRAATKKAKSLGGEVHEGRHGSNWHGLAELYPGSDRRRSGALAVQRKMKFGAALSGCYRQEGFNVNRNQPNHLSTMEHGKVEIGAEILLRISREFGKSIE